ncbi:MAG: hypothetical protein ACW986_08045 [Promethearchaeota archaeon]|jgi:hypothetical protein
MTKVTEEQFLNKLLEVVYKLSNIAKTQTYRLKMKWDEYLKPINEQPYVVRQILLDKKKFLVDLEYRINVLKNVEQAILDGFYTIKSLLQTFYNIYFDSTLFKQDFSKEDQLILKYFVAKQILFNLIQYNKIDHETVPLKYNIIARNYTIMKLKGPTDKGQTDREILSNMEKLNIKNLDLPGLHKIMEEVEIDGVVSIKDRDGQKYYRINEPLELSVEGKKHYSNLLAPIVDWPTGFWRSFYNIRELNVTLDESCSNQEELDKNLSKTATQGFSPALNVFRGLIKYYEKIKKEEEEKKKKKEEED